MYIKSNWFDSGNNIFKAIGCEGFFLYLNLFRFRLFNQDNEYTFILSISLLRKETGYSAQRILELLKLMSKKKIIKVNISRWDRLIDDTGIVLVDKLLIIEAQDKPDTYRGFSDKKEEVDMPKSKDDYYISLDMPLVQQYINLKLGERYLGLHCLINKYSNGTEGKCWLSINHMADILGFGDKTVNSMIHEMNRKYLLYSRYLETDKKVVGKSGVSVSGSKFEHFLLSNLDHKEQWMHSFKDSVDRNVRKWDRGSNSKSKDYIDSDNVAAT